MSFKNVSISPQSASLNSNDAITVHYDLSFTLPLPILIQFDYQIIGSACALFAVNSKPSWSEKRTAGIVQNNYQFDRKLTIIGTCTNDAFTLKVTCIIADDSFEKLIAISFNPIAALLDANLHDSLMKEVQTRISKSVKAGIQKHVKELHSKKLNK